MSHPGTAHPPDGSVRPHLALAERVHRIDGVINFRDIGGGITEDGRRIRTGRLYRSASLDAIRHRCL